MQGKFMLKKLLIMSVMIFSIDSYSATAVVKTTPVTIKTSSVKVLWCSDCSKTTGLDENSKLQTYSDWYYTGVVTPKTPSTTIEKMVLDGWNIQQVVPAGITNQFYIVFTK